MGLSTTMLMQASIIRFKDSYRKVSALNLLAKSVIKLAYWSCSLARGPEISWGMKL